MEHVFIALYQSSSAEEDRKILTSIAATVRDFMAFARYSGPQLRARIDYLWQNRYNALRQTRRLTEPLLSAGLTKPTLRDWATIFRGYLDLHFDSPRHRVVPVATKGRGSLNGNPLGIPKAVPAASERKEDNNGR